MPFSCCFFLPEVAPGLTVPSLDAPGAGWFWADAMCVEPKSDVTTRAEIASLDRIRNVSMGYRTPPNLERRLGSARDQHSAKFISKEFVCGRRATSVTLQTSVTLRTQD